MRLNVDALSDLVILRSGPSGLTVALTSTLAFTVNSLADTYPGAYDDPDTAVEEDEDGICADEFGNCTLRAALEEASNI
jgi:CSLREA domain-containing protein